MDPVPDRGRNVYIAKLADSAERYEDAIQLMKEVALMNVELTTEERDLMSSAYHNVIASRKSSWKTLVAIEIAQTMKGEMEFVPQIREFVEKVAGEISDFCTEATSILTRHVLPQCTSPDHQVFYYTMMGDCYRYHAGVKNEDLIQREGLVHNAMTAYANGVNIAEENLHAADPIRLALALNFSVFHYEILRSVENAREIAQKACDEARPLPSTMDFETRLKSEQILTVLSTNLALWANENVVNVATTLEGPELVD